MQPLRLSLRALAGRILADLEIDDREEAKSLDAVSRIADAALVSVRQRRGAIVNISSIGVQTNTPRFSAYVASKAALDAWSRCVASEVIDDGVHITTIYMPLVRTPMIAPTKMYDAFPTSTPEEAAEMITNAMISKPKKVATRLGNFGELLYNVAPKASDAILNTAYKLFPESSAAKGKDDGKPAEKEKPKGPPKRASQIKRMKGLEPSTFCMASRRSSQLSYSRARPAV